MRTFYLLLVLCLAAINLRPIITSVAPLLATIQTSLGMSGIAISLLTTLPVLCMGIFAPFATKLKDRVGLERAIFIALIVITAATAMRGIAATAMMLLLTAFIAGIGIGLAGPLLSAFIKKYFPTKPGIVSVYSVSLNVGAGIASVLAIPIYTESKHSLNITFGIWSVFGIIALIVWLGLLKQKSITAQQQGRTQLPLRNKRALLLTLFFGLMASLFYSFTAWLSPIAQSLGYSKSSAAIILTAFTLVQIPVSMTLPSIVSRFGRRKLFLVLCSVLELIGLMMIILHLPVLPAAILLGLGAGGLFPLALMLPIVETRNAEEAGSWSAMSQSGGYIIGAMGPLVIGIIHDYSGSFSPVFILMLIQIVAMIGVQQLIGDRKVSAAKS